MNQTHLPYNILLLLGRIGCMGRPPRYEPKKRPKTLGGNLKTLASGS